MKKVAIYCRVSTALQEQEKTIDSQLAELREICKDCQIVKEYLDNGYSGEMLDRPALDELRNDVKEGLFEAVYIHSADRLSRNLYHQGIVVEELKKKGIEIFIGDKPIADTPEGRFMFNVLGAAAEFEKEKILERTKRGRIFKAKQKGIVGTVPPFGYSYIKKDPSREGYYKINKKEAEIVRLIFDLYIEYQSLKKVIKELVLRKVKTRTGREIWGTSVVARVLRREDYIGIGYYRKTYSVEIDNGKKYRKVVKGGRRLRDRKEWIPIEFPPIIDREKFRLVQETLSKKYKPYGNSKHFYLLSGLVKCANCNSSLAGDTTKSHSYYRCNNRHRKFPFPKDCNAKMVKKDKLENAIWSTVAKAISDPQIIIRYVLDSYYKTNKSKPELSKEKKTLLRKKGNLNGKIDRLLEIYTDGVISKKQFSEKSTEFEQIKIEIDKRLEEIDGQLNKLINRPLIAKDIKYFCNLAKTMLKTFKLEEKRRFLRYLIKKILFDSNKKSAKVIGQIPVEISDVQKIFPPYNAGTLSLQFQNHGTCPRNYFEFQLEVKI